MCQMNPGPVQLIHSEHQTAAAFASFTNLKWVYNLLGLIRWLGSSLDLGQFTIWIHLKTI